MTSGPGNVDDWREVIVWALIALPAIIGAVTGILSLRHAAEAAADTKAVREQVENDHGSVLRDDIDALAASLERVEDVIERHGDGIRLLHTKVDRVDDKSSRIGDEVRIDRKLRRESDAAIRRELAEAVDRAETVIAKHHPEDAR